MIRTILLLGAIALALVLLSPWGPVDVDDLIDPPVEIWEGERPWFIGAADNAFSYDGTDARRIAGQAELHLASTPQRSRLTVRLPMSPTERLSPGAVVFAADNVCPPDAGSDLLRQAGSEDTFRQRLLAD